MSFLNIIIPQYNENDSVIDRLLSSINNQKNVDFSDIDITIINDGSSTIISDSVFKKYDMLNIKYIKNDTNLGAGPIRQKAYDETSSEYVTYVDGDDEFCDENSLALIIGCLKDTHKDILITNVSVEKILDGKLVNISKLYRASHACLHAKYMRREYLDKHNIRFSDKLRNNYEDAYFCMCLVGADPLNASIIHLNIDSYIWKYNPTSITKTTEASDYFERTIDDYLTCTYETCDFLKKKNSIMLNPYIVDSIMTLYQIINSNMFINKEKRYQVLLKLKEMYKNNKHCFSTSDKELKNKYKEVEEKMLQLRNEFINNKKYNDFKNDMR